MRSVRVGWGALLICTLAGLALARVLEPAAAGHGTHMQLGLPPCGFLWLTGWPCPACGLTTSFAHMARLQLRDAVAANPIGVALFFSAITSIPVAVAGWWRRWTLDDALQRFQAPRLAVWFAAGLIATWVARLAAHATAVS